MPAKKGAPKKGPAKGPATRSPSREKKPPVEADTPPRKRSTSRSRASAKKTASPKKGRSASQGRTPGKAAAASRSPSRSRKSAATAAPKTPASKKATESITAAAQRDTSPPAPPAEKTTRLRQNNASSAAAQKPATSVAPSTAKPGRPLKSEPKQPKRGGGLLKRCSGCLYNVRERMGFWLPWGGPLGAHFVAGFLLLAPFAGYTLATQRHPVLWRWPPPLVQAVQTLINTTRADYFRLPTYAGYGSFFLFQLLLGFLPLNRLVHGGALQYGNVGRRLTYRCAGLARLVLTAAGLAALYYWRKNDLLELSRNWRALLAIMAGTGFLSGFTMYLVSLLPAFSPREHVHHATGGCWPYNCLIGGLLHPRIPALARGALDLKLWAIETCVITWLTLDGLWLIDNVNNGQAQVLVAFHVVYGLVYLWNERAILYSAEMAEEGFGLIQSLTCLYSLPWLLSLPVSFLTHVSHGPQWAWPYKIGLSALFVLGVGLFHWSRALKTRFRVDPHHMDLSRMKGVLGTDGNRILADGPYRLIRHPQSLAALLMLTACALIAGFSYLLPWGLFVLGVAVVIRRIYAAEVKMANSYGATWDAYKYLVPKMIVPFIL